MAVIIVIIVCVCVCAQTLLTECVGPHMEEIGTVTASASSGNASYVCRMFR